MKVSYAVPDKIKLFHEFLASDYGEKGISQVEAGSQVPQTILILFSEDVTPWTAMTIGVTP